MTKMYMSIDADIDKSLVHIFYTTIMRQMGFPMSFSTGRGSRKDLDKRWDSRCLFLGLAGYTSRWMLKCAEINMRRRIFASRKARPEDADPSTKLKLMSFPVSGLSRPPLLLTRVRHSSSPLRRPRLLGNWYALLAALLTSRASGGSCAHRGPEFLLRSNLSLVLRLCVLLQERIPVPFHAIRCYRRYDINMKLTVSEK